MEIPIRYPDVHRKVKAAMESGDWVGAERELNRARGKDPLDVALLILRTTLLTEQGRQDEVPEIFREAIGLMPDSVLAHLHFATWLERHRRAPEAIELLERLGPSKAEREVFLSIFYKLLAENGRFGEVESDVRELVSGAKVPAASAAAASLLIRIYSGLGDQESALNVATEADLHAADRVSSGRTLLICSQYSGQSSPEHIASLHKSYGEGIEAAVPLISREFPNNRNPDRKLRVGWVSADFCSHVVSDFLLEVLRNWDGDSIEHHLYSHGVHDEVTLAYQEVSRFHDMRDLSPGDLARRIRSDKIDVLIDLMGHTYASMVPMFAMRPAPVQITYLGYPATTGFSRVQARLVDEITDPIGSEHFCSERLIRIPGGFLGYSPVREHPNDVVDADPVPTFGCFNNPAKISSAAIRMFAGCLHEVPESRLLLKSSLPLSHELQDRGQARFRELFLAEGIDPSRVEFLPFVRSEMEAFRQFGRCHVSLDPTPYSGTTCTCQLLQHGIPVVALLGEDHRSRVSGSILHHAGFGDWVAEDEASYVSIAARLVRDTEACVANRKKVAQSFLDSNVCKPERVATEISAAIRQLWQEWCADPR